MTDIVLIPDPNRTLTVLRNEAEAARDGTLVIDGPDIEMAELLDDAADEIERLRHQCEKLAAAALSNGEDLLRHENEVERLRAENERLRADVKFVREQIDEYVSSRFDPGMMSPTLDRIRWHFWDQDDTANTAANTADAATNENDAKP